MPNLPFSTSGWSTHNQVGQVRLDFPYPDAPSIYTVTRTFEGPLSSYSGPTMAAADAVYTSHYLDHVGELQPLDAGQVRYSRVYAPVPSTRYDYTTRAIVVPAVPESVSDDGTDCSVSTEMAPTTFTDNGSGARWVRASNGRAYVWTPTQKLFGPVTLASAVTIGSSRVVTGGTFTLTYKAQTTAALAYNESAANIKTAIEALSTVIADGFTVTVTNNLGSSGALTIAVASGTAQAAFALASSLTPDVASVVFLTYSSFATQNFVTATSVSAAAHGFTNTGPLVLMQTLSSSRAVREIPSSRWAVYDANTLALYPGVGAALTLYNFAAYVRSYTPGTRRLNLRIKSDFYLPGVTPGIASVDDIPLPVSVEEVNAFLEAALTQSDYADYSSEDLVRWLGGQVYRREVNQLDFGQV